MLDIERIMKGHAATITTKAVLYTEDQVIDIVDQYTTAILDDIMQGWVRDKENYIDELGRPALDIYRKKYNKNKKSK